MSRSNVSSVLIEMRSVTVSSPRGSMPRARSRRSVPDLAGQQPPQVGVAERGERSDRLEAGRAQARLGAGPDARQLADVERGQERRPPSRPGRPSARRACAGRSRSWRRPCSTRLRSTRSGSSRLGQTSVPLPRRRAPRRSWPPPRPGRGTPRRFPSVRRSAPPHARRVQTSLRVLLVDAVPRAHEHGVRAAPQGLGARHRRMDPELPGLVVGGRDDSASVGVAAHDSGFERSSGFSSSSTAAKKASRSRCPRITHPRLRAASDLATDCC